MKHIAITSLLISSIASSSAFAVLSSIKNLPSVSTETALKAKFDTSGMWNAGLNYGKGMFKFYKSFDSW